MGRPSPARRAGITVEALRYMATHMEEVLNVDPGPHDIADTDVDDAFLVELFRNEADKLRRRADKIAAWIRANEVKRG